MLRTITKRISAVALAALVLPFASACTRSLPADPAATGPAPPGRAPAPARAPGPARTSSPSPPPSSPSPSPGASAPASLSASAPAPRRTIDGPHTLRFAPGRSALYALPGDPPKPGARPFRLVGHLHGICHAPSYSCGQWLGAAVDVGALVCPTGNARCGDANVGPPSWEAPTWGELVSIMDTDLERSIATLDAKHPGVIRRGGAVLTGWSRGAFAAPVIARMHPNRWPYLILIEANVPLSAASLRKAGVRAVALLAGERGTEIAGERKTQAELEEAGFPAKLFVMRGVAHLYPDDMDRLMGEAFDFVLSQERGRDEPGRAPSL